MLYEFKGHRPVVDPTSFVHPQAAVTGNVIIGKQVYIGPGAAIRGDWGQIVIEDGCNVQENCTIHMFPGVTVRLMEGAHLGHGAIVHGATIGRNCLIGMNAVIMDSVVVGDDCIIGALSFVKEGTAIPARSVVVGNPAKVVKQVSDEMLDWKTEGTAIYQRLPGDMQESWGETKPLTPLDEYINRGARPGKSSYRPWKERQSTATKADHNTIAINIIIALGIKLRGSSFQIFNSDQRINIEENTLFAYPDASIVCGEATFLKNDDWNLTNPAAIIEVLSPPTKGYDRGEKFNLYKQLPTLLEYILVDSQSVLVEHFVKDADGKWILRKYDRLDAAFLLGTAGVSLSLGEIYEKVRFLKVQE